MVTPRPRKKKKKSMLALLVLKKVSGKFRHEGNHSPNRFFSQEPEPGEVKKSAQTEGNADCRVLFRIFFTHMAQRFHHYGQYGNQDDAVNDQAEVFLHKRAAAEEIPGRDQGKNPDQRAGHVEE